MKQRRAKPEKIRHDKRERIDRFKTSFFIAPSFIGAAIFFILPFFVVGYYALIDNPISQEFVGLQNFVNLFGNAAFRTAAKNTAVFAAVVALVSLAGLSGMVSAFSATVPVLAAVTLVFGALSVWENGIVLPQGAVASSNPLMGSWEVAAVSFACYNVFGGIAMVAPLGKFIKSKGTAVGGIAIGTALLLLIACSVLVSVSASPEVCSAQLPMLALAQERGIVWGGVYGVLLLLAMFGTALSGLVALVNMLAAKFPRVETRRKPFTAVVALGMFLGSLFGFGDLIGVVYPIFGYCSSVFIILMTVHYFRCCRRGDAP